MDNCIQRWTMMKYNSSSRNEERSDYMWTSTQGENNFHSDMKLISKLNNKNQVFMSGWRNCDYIHNKEVSPRGEFSVEFTRLGWKYDLLCN